jgi:hypothetical protein
MTGSYQSEPNSVLYGGVQCLYVACVKILRISEVLYLGLFSCAIGASTQFEMVTNMWPISCASLKVY